MSKYNSKKTVIDGIVFDSKNESLYYEFLKKEKKNKVIKDFKLQPVFILEKGKKIQGKTLKDITYIADFLVIKNDGSEYVVDVKGMATEVANIKRKLFMLRYPETPLYWVVRNLKYSKDYGYDGQWVDYDVLKKVKSAEKRKMKKAI